MSSLLEKNDTTHHTTSLSHPYFNKKGEPQATSHNEHIANETGRCIDTDRRVRRYQISDTPVLSLFFNTEQADMSYIMTKDSSTANERMCP